MLQEDTTNTRMKTLQILEFWRRILRKTCELWDLPDIFWQKMSRSLGHTRFSQNGKYYKKWFCMVVNNPLFRGLGNIAKLYNYLITCSQSACSKLKKHEFCQNFNVELPLYKLHHKISSIILNT